MLVKRLRYSLLGGREGLAEPTRLPAWHPGAPPPPALGTHGVSSITLQTQAMVLRQSVVSSIGRVLF